MNYYMPYTYLSEAMIETLTAAFGLLAVTQPSAASVPPHMQAAADRGSLQLMFPRQVDTQRLEDTLQAFNQWADVHHGSGGTLKGLFLSGQHARTEEASANQIRGVLRRFDAASPQSTPDPVFQAALFLALAQSYDRQHDALNLDLAGVSDLERRLERILGEQPPRPPDGGAEARPAPGRAASAPMADHMLDQRLAAWACASASHLRSDTVLVTGCRQVWAHVSSIFPEMLPMGEFHMDLGVDRNVGKAGLPALVSVKLAALSATDTPEKIPLDDIGDATGGHGDLWVCIGVVTGRSPVGVALRFDDEMHSVGNMTASAESAGNTVIVLAEPCGT